MTEPLKLVETEAIETPEFDDFWTLWPAERRIDKKHARIYWNQIPDDRKVGVLVALVGWVKIWRAKEEWEFVPHPFRWLRDERYEDALPDSVRGVGTATVIPKVGPRQPMPQFVRDMLATLRKG